MTTNKKAFLVGCGAAVLILPLFASAASFHANEQVNLSAEETIADDVYATGGTITSDSRIVGDLYAGGGTVLVGGAVGADAVITGGTVTISGDVGDDLRIAGGTITVQGAVQGDVIIGGGQVQLSGSRIGGDLWIGAGSVRIEAPVGKNVKVGGGEVYINAAIAGSVEVDADKLTLGPKARIAGNLNYTSLREVVIEEGAVVSGTTNYQPRDEHGVPAGFLLAVFSAAAIAFILMLALGAFVFALFFKRYAQEVVENSFAAPFLELGRGLLVFIAMPIISVLLLISIIGLPLGLLGLMLYVALLIFSWLIAPVLIGSLVYHWIYKGEYVVSWKTILLGLAVFFLLGIVPVLGGLAQLGFMILSLGSIARLKWHIAKSWR